MPISEVERNLAKVFPREILDALDANSVYDMRMNPSLSKNLPSNDKKQ